MRWILIALVILLAFVSGCESEADRLGKEGYTNIREMHPLEPCPVADPSLDSSFVAERDGKSWEIKRCCHQESYESVCPAGSICSGSDDDLVCFTTYVPCIAWRTVCSRYVRALAAEGV